MPHDSKNHVRCQLIIHDNPMKRNKILKHISSPERAIDFEKIMPYPDDIYRGPLTEEALKQYGDKNWYEWNKVHWEAYYNAYDTHKCKNGVQFTTAWKPPIKLMFTLFGQLGAAKMEFDWCSLWKPGGCGHMELNGINITTKQYDGDSIQYQAMYDTLWGCHPEWLKDIVWDVCNDPYQYKPCQNNPYNMEG